MASFTAVSRDELQRFLKCFDLRLVAVAGIPQGSVNSNYRLEVERAGEGERAAGPAPLFLRLYEEQDARGAEAEAALLRTLEDRGVPTPAPLRRKAGAAVGVLSEKPAALFPWREGTMRCQASVTAEDAEAVGAALGRVHVASTGLARGPGRFRRVDLEARLDRIDAAGETALRVLGKTLRSELTAVDGARDSDLPRGLVHGDLFRDNVLFAGENDPRVVALLDFESAFDGTFAFDLAVCLLSWTYGDDFDPALGRAMVRGYESVRPLPPAERSGLYEEARFAALRFSITRITDFAMRRSARATDDDAPAAARVEKDHRRFVARFERLTAMGRDGVREAWSLA